MVLGEIIRNLKPGRFGAGKNMTLWFIAGCLLQPTQRYTNFIGLIVVGTD
jgi:hypothetical protein